MKKQKYDFAFGLGIVCSCSETLRAAGMQYLSFPYDWITTTADDPEERDRDILYRVREICDGFSTWFRPDDFKFQQHLPEIGKDQYANTRLKLLFNHDFVTGVPYEKAFPLVTEKYRRRGNRLIAGIRAAKRVLILHVDRPDRTDVERADIVRQSQQELERHFASTRFDFFLLSYEKGLPLEKRRTEILGDGITRVTFDYRDYTPGKQPYQVDIRTTGALLASMFQVRDYRTRAEKRKFRQQKWEKRCKKAGVKNRTEYHLAQVSSFLHGRYNLVGDLTARLKRKRFEQIIVLGFNCEAAFRFVCKWDFLDSSLLAWTNSRDLGNLAKALGNFNQICAGEMEFHEKSRMWQCMSSRIFFHGKMRAVPGSPQPTEEEKASDLADLRARAAHLKEKFLTYATNEKSTLFVYKIRPEDAELPEFGAQLAALESAIEALGAKNWRLLVICERNQLAKMPPGPNREFRAVTRFNPGNDVTSRKKGDPAGWNRIFSEFAPARILKRAHKFKYE